MFLQWNPAGDLGEDTLELKIKINNFPRLKNFGLKIVVTNM